MTTRAAAAWAFYWIGDLWWLATEWLGAWFEWPYRVYSWLMRKSNDWQGDGPDGPWSAVPGPLDPKEIIATWMIMRGYATGHGDTIEDLLAELEFQAKERGRWSRRKLHT